MDRLTTTSRSVCRDEVWVALKRFTDSEELKVLAVKGDWGVGKTHLIRHFLREEKISHFYGSTFGLDSVDALQSQLIVNSGRLQVEDEPGARYNIVRRALNRALAWRDLLNMTKLGVLLPIANDLLYSMIRDAVVCIDDLERKTGGLDTTSLLGFISDLVENRSCKVILVFNEKHLEEADREVINRFREKVLDVEVELAPTFEENLGVILESRTNQERTVAKCLSDVGTTNIRLMKKVFEIADAFSEPLAQWEDATRLQFFRNLTIISIARLDPGFRVPFSEFPRAFPVPTAYSRDESKAAEEREKDYFLSKVGYSHLPTDRHIVEYLSKLSYDPKSFAREAAEINRREKESQVRLEYRRVWKRYGASFASDESEIREELKAFLEKCCDLLYRSEFRAIAELGAAVGFDLSQYEERFWESLIDRTDSDHLRALAPEVGHLSGVSGKLERRIQESKVERTITSVLSVENGFLSEGDIQYLNERSEGDFTKWLVEGHRDLPQMVRAGLEGQNKYSLTIRDAIRRLGRESSLNRMRAEKLYGVAD